MKITFSLFLILVLTVFFTFGCRSQPEQNQPSVVPGTSPSGGDSGSGDNSAEDLGTLDDTLDDLGDFDTDDLDNIADDQSNF
ncbi:MAG: hypothetical protein AABW64_02735 [Nanoarchaeota archaeon]